MLIKIQNSLSPLVRGSLYYAIFWSAIAIYAPFINVYFAQLGFSGRQISLLSTFPPLLSLLIAMPLAALADRRRWRVRILSGALIGFSLTLLIANLPRTFPAWVMVAWLMAAFICPIVPLSDSLIARMSIRHNLNYGSMRLWGSFGFAATAVACGALWQRIGTDSMFIVSSLVVILTLFFANMLEEGEISTNKQAVSLREIGRDTGFMVILLASFLIGAALQLSVIFDGIYMSYLGGTSMLIGVMFGVSALHELPTMHYNRVIIRRIGGPKTLLLSYSLLLTAYIGYALAWHPWILLLMTAMKGLGFGLFIVTTIYLVNERTPDNWAATVQSMINASIFGLSPLLAAAIGGEIYDRWGPSAVYGCSSLFVGLAGVVMVVAMARGVFAELGDKEN